MTYKNPTIKSYDFYFHMFFFVITTTYPYIIGNILEKGDRK